MTTPDERAPQPVELQSDPADETITRMVTPATADELLEPLPPTAESVTEVVFESVPAAAMSVPAVGGDTVTRRDTRARGVRFGGRKATAPAFVAPSGGFVPNAGAAMTAERLAPSSLLGGDLSANPQSYLEAKLISAWFGEHQVLQDVSLMMPAGQVTALIGPSGCGKSTFLRILNRMHELVPSATLAGEVLLDGDDIYEATLPVVEARKRIGMVFQKPNPFPAMSIYDNVLAGLALTGIRADRDRKDYLVESCLTKAGLWNELKDRLRAPGGGLSGGQQQRLCIARSLAVTPRILLMDEPCSALDPTSTRVIEETMLELAHEVTIVIVTHNMQQAQRVSNQCAFFLASQGQPGHIVEHGDTAAMFDSPIDPRTYDYVNGRFG
jgi:phosphate transport system ATP-binding protein